MLSVELFVPDIQFSLRIELFELVRLYPSSLLIHQKKKI